jgi:hypothetical protein
MRGCGYGEWEQCGQFVRQTVRDPCNLYLTASNGQLSFRIKVPFTLYLIHLMLHHIQGLNYSKHTKTMNLLFSRSRKN